MTSETLDHAAEAERLLRGTRLMDERGITTQVLPRDVEQAKTHAILALVEKADDINSGLAALLLGIKEMTKQVATWQKAQNAMIDNMTMRRP